MVIFLFNVETKQIIRIDLQKLQQLIHKIAIQCNVCFKRYAYNLLLPLLKMMQISNHINLYFNTNLYKTTLMLDLTSDQNEDPNHNYLCHPLWGLNCLRTGSAKGSRILGGQLWRRQDWCQFRCTTRHVTRVSFKNLLITNFFTILMETI